MKTRRCGIKSIIIVLTLLISMISPCVSVDAATKVALNKKSAAISVKDTVKLKLNGATKEPTWSSSNKKIAKVDKKGKVTGIKAGKVTITAKLGKKKYTCKITVKAKPKTITINKSKTSKATLYVGETLTIKNVKNSKDKIVKYSSDKKSVATVSNKGVVTAKKPGTAVITAKTAAGKNLKCKVTVNQKETAPTPTPVPTPAPTDTPTPTPTNTKVSGITIPTSKNILKGNHTNLSVVVAPENATNKAIIWASDNTAVATVADGVVTGVSAGTANITATAADGSGVSASCQVTVTENWYDIVEVSTNKGQVVDFKVQDIDFENNCISLLVVGTLSGFPDSFALTVADGVTVLSTENNSTYRISYNNAYFDVDIGYTNTQEVLMPFDLRYEDDWLSWDPDYDTLPNYNFEEIISDVVGFGIKLPFNKESFDANKLKITYLFDDIIIENVNNDGYTVSYKDGKKVNVFFEFVGDISQNYEIASVTIDGEEIDSDSFETYYFIYNGQINVLNKSFERPDPSSIVVKLKDPSLSVDTTKLEWDDEYESMHCDVKKDGEICYSFVIFVYPDVTEILDFKNININKKSNSSESYSIKVESEKSFYDMDDEGYYIGNIYILDADRDTPYTDYLDNIGIIELSDAVANKENYSCELDADNTTVIFKLNGKRIAYCYVYPGYWLDDEED